MLQNIRKRLSRKNRTNSKSPKASQDSGKEEMDLSHEAVVSLIAGEDEEAKQTPDTDLISHSSGCHVYEASSISSDDRDSTKPEVSTSVPTVPFVHDELESLRVQHLARNMRDESHQAELQKSTMTTPKIPLSATEAFYMKQKEQKKQLKKKQEDSKIFLTSYRATSASNKSETSTDVAHNNAVRPQKIHLGSPMDDFYLQQRVLNQEWKQKQRDANAYLHRYRGYALEDKGEEDVSEDVKLSRFIFEYESLIASQKVAAAIPLPPSPPGHIFEKNDDPSLLELRKVAAAVPLPLSPLSEADGGIHDFENFRITSATLTQNPDKVEGSTTSVSDMYTDTSLDIGDDQPQVRSGEVMDAINGENARVDSLLNADFSDQTKEVVTNVEHPLDSDTQVPSEQERGEQEDRINEMVKTDIDVESSIVQVAPYIIDEGNKLSGEVMLENVKEDTSVSPEVDLLAKEGEDNGISGESLNVCGVEPTIVDGAPSDSNCIANSRKVDVLENFDNESPVTKQNLDFNGKEIVSDNLSQEMIEEVVIDVKDGNPLMELSVIPDSAAQCTEEQRMTDELKVGRVDGAGNVGDIGHDESRRATETESMEQAVDTRYAGNHDLNSERIIHMSQGETLETKGQNLMEGNSSSYNKEEIMELTNMTDEVALLANEDGVDCGLGVSEQKNAGHLTETNVMDLKSDSTLSLGEEIDEFDNILDDLLLNTASSESKSCDTQAVEPASLHNSSLTPQSKIPLPSSKIPQGITTKGTSGKKSKNAISITPRKFESKIVSPRLTTNNALRRSPHIVSNIAMPRAQGTSAYGRVPTSCPIEDGGENILSQKNRSQYQHSSSPTRSVSSIASFRQGTMRTPASRNSSPCRSVSSATSGQSVKRQSAFRTPASRTSSPSRSIGSSFSGISCRRERIELCKGKLIPELHESIDGCERCLDYLEHSERLQFLKDGHHPRVNHVRGGCSRSCMIFPRGENEAPVRLCRQCFYDTHYTYTPQKGTYENVFNGNWPTKPKL